MAIALQDALVFEVDEAEAAQFRGIDGELAAANVAQALEMV